MLKKIVEEVKVQTGEDTLFEDVEGEPVPHALRLTVAKLLIEVAEWEDALYMLNGLYDEDSSNLDVSYMLAFVNFKLQKYAQTNDLLKEL
jgi:predicted Zn-dependent protease